MQLQPFLQWLENTPTATAIRESAYLFPVFESLHVLAITLVVGTIAVVDLRLLGLLSRERRVSVVMAEVLPFTWIAFTAAAITGGLLFSSHAVDYMQKMPFLIKLGLLVAAGVNIVLFHLVTARNIHQWDMETRLPMPVKLAGAVSLTVWIGIVTFGRWIGFV